MHIYNNICNISVKFITKIAENCDAEKLVVTMIKLMVHAISKVVRVYVCVYVETGTMLCNVFILFRSNGMNGLEKFFWQLDIFWLLLGFISLYFCWLAAAAVAVAVGWMHIFNLSSDFYMYVDIFGLPEVTSHIRDFFIGKWIRKWARTQACACVRVQHIIQNVLMNMHELFSLPIYHQIALLASHHWTNVCDMFVLGIWYSYRVVCTYVFAFTTTQYDGSRKMTA